MRRFAGAAPLTQAVAAVHGVRAVGDVSDLDESGDNFGGLRSVEVVVVAAELAVGADEGHHASPPFADSMPRSSIGSGRGVGLRRSRLAAACALVTAR